METNMNKPLFIGHGSPMNAIADNAYTQFLQNYALSIPKPSAIVVISAHWQTKGTYVTGNRNPEQIYDFYGFPDELYEIQYSPSGSTVMANEIAQQIAGIGVDITRGVDHAGWAVVKHMYPDQGVPLLELSLDLNKSEHEHFLLGKSLRRLCDNVLFIGSGNVVHNLGDISFRENEKPFTWAVKADAWINEKITQNQFEPLIEYRTNMPDYKRSIPTNEHYLPLLYILGMKDEHDRIATLYEGIQNGSISMRSIAIE